MIKSLLMLSLLDNHTIQDQDLFTKWKKFFLKKTTERAPWEGLNSPLCFKYRCELIKRAISGIRRRIDF